MTPEETNQLQSAVFSDSSFDAIYEILKKLKASGVTQTEPEAALEAMRRSATDKATEDRILETLDIVTGWCRPEVRIWGDQP